MLFFGHPLIESEKFYTISKIDDVKDTPSNSCVVFEFENSTKLINYLQTNGVNFALKVLNIEQLLLAAALDASYIMVPKSIAKQAQKIATEYLFDAKILCHIEQGDSLEEFASFGLDGVVYSSAIVN